MKIIFQISFCTCVPKVRKLLVPFFKVFFYVVDFILNLLKSNDISMSIKVYGWFSGQIQARIVGIERGKSSTPTSRSINANFTKSVGTGG